MMARMARKQLSVAQALGQERVDRRIAILREIGAQGSISQAARAVGVSYKAAWQALDTLTNLAGVALVERAVGGAGVAARGSPARRASCWPPPTRWRASAPGWRRAAACARRPRSSACAPACATNGPAP